MPTYTDGFVIPIARQNLEAYRKMAETAGGIWREHGALDYKECVLEDEGGEMCQSFRQGLNLSEDETAIFSWITYPSRAERDRINAAVMEDPRIKDSCGDDFMPFDPARMMYSGFEVIVESSAAPAGAK